MKTRTRLGLGAVAGLVVACLLPGGAGSAATAAEADRSRADEAQYLYAVTFVADVTYDLRNESGDLDYEMSKATATIRGTLPNVVVGSRNGLHLEPRGAAGSVRVAEASASSSDTQDDRRWTEECEGDTATATGPAYIEPGILSNNVQLFTTLDFPMDCTDSEGGSDTATTSLGQVAAETLDKSGAVGDDRYTIRVAGDAVLPPEYPFPDKARCPGYVEGQNVWCDYTVEGTLTLDLIKRLDPDQAPHTGAEIKGKKVRVQVVTPAKCVVDIEVAPLRGGATVAEDRVKPPARKPVTVTIPIPLRKWDVVKQSGGVRITLTYHCPDGVKITQHRTARL